MGLGLGVERMGLALALGVLEFDPYDLGPAFFAVRHVLLTLFEGGRAPVALTYLRFGSLRRQKRPKPDLTASIPRRQESPEPGTGDNVSIVTSS